MIKRNKDIEELKAFKEEAEERLQKSKINEAVNLKRIEKAEKNLVEMDEYLKTTAAATGGLNKEEFIKLLAMKAQKDINEK